MEKIIIIALVILVIYLYYQQNNLVQPGESTELQAQKAQANHYQKLYQTRVAKDLEQQEYVGMLNQKITDLETALLNLAKQKTKGKKEFQKVVEQLETNWQQDKNNWAQQQKKRQQEQQILQKLQNFHQLVEKTSGPSLDRSQVNQAEALVEQITQPEIKQLASWMITDSAFVLGHNNLLTKLADQEDKLENIREQNNSLVRKNQDLTEELKAKGEFYQQELAKSVPSTSDREHQEQLGEIYALFDLRARGMKEIDFNQLMKLLKGVESRKTPTFVTNEFSAFLKELNKLLDEALFNKEKVRKASLEAMKWIENMKRQEQFRNK